MPQNYLGTDLLVTVRGLPLVAIKGELMVIIKIIVSYMRWIESLLLLQTG